MAASSLFLVSCSSLWSHRTANKTGNVESPPKMVPREQYEELARKYQELLNQAKNDKKLNNVKPESAVIEDIKIAEAQKEASNEIKPAGEHQVRPAAPVNTNIDPSELVNHIDQAIPDQKVADGVDVIGAQITPPATKEEKVGPAVPPTMGIEHVNVTDDIDEQISKLREASNLVKVNKFENALVILKELENSKEKQVAVRAKIMLGDLLFSQGEFDLAMQVYEEVVKKYAFSGYVLKALGKLVACSEKLKLPEKQAKYYSLLHDFFEAT